MQSNFLGLADSCDPRAFLSEGHLDSLGLCLYLATVRTFNPPGTMLVLDDVLTSIDREHRHRVAELLFEEFADFQLVLTTHDEHWFDILQTKARARGDQGNWLFKRIVRWTVEKGPESAAFESTWSHIEANLTDDSYRELGGPLRVIVRQSSKVKEFNFFYAFTHLVRSFWPVRDFSELSELSCFRPSPDLSRLGAARQSGLSPDKAPVGIQLRD